MKHIIAFLFCILSASAFAGQTSAQITISATVVDTCTISNPIDPTKCRSLVTKQATVEEALTEVVIYEPITDPYPRMIKASLNENGEPKMMVVKQITVRF